MKLKLYQQSSETKFVEHPQKKYSTFNKSLSDDGAVGVGDVPFSFYTDNATLEHFDESSSSSHKADDSTLNDSKAYLLLSLEVWAIECNITHTSLAKLLCILKKFHPYISKDPRTLLKSSQLFGITELAGGHYYHFGVKQSIKQCLACDPKLQQLNKLNLQVNLMSFRYLKAVQCNYGQYLG